MEHEKLILTGPEATVRIAGGRAHKTLLRRNIDMGRLVDYLAVVQALRPVEQAGAVELPAVVSCDRLGYPLIESASGETLRARMKCGPLKMVDAVAALADVARSIELLERLSVTHGAIHAGNVVLDHGGRWRLTDVALASTLGLSWSTWVALKRAKQRLGIVATSAGVDWWCFEALCREVFAGCSSGDDVAGGTFPARFSGGAEAWRRGWLLGGDR